MTIDNNTRAMLDCFTDGPSGLVFWSFRYFLGRRTIHACAFARELAAAWHHLPEREQASIRRELDQAFADDDRMRADVVEQTWWPLGHQCNRDSWAMVRAVYMKEVG